MFSKSERSVYVLLSHIQGCIKLYWEKFKSKPSTERLTTFSYGAHHQSLPLSLTTVLKTVACRHALGTLCLFFLFYIFLPALIASKILQSLPVCFICCLISHH